MRIDRINLSVDTDGKTGKVRSASIYFENVTDIGERVSGQFAITLDEYERIQREEILPETIAEKKLVELFGIQPEDDVTAAFVQLSEQLAQKDLEISALQQMIVELTLMLSMIGQPELPTEPDPEPPIEEEPEPPEEDPLPPDDPEPPADPEPEPPTETPEEPPVEDPPQEDPDIPPEEGAPDDPEPETPADPVADDPDTTPIDEGGEGGE